MDVKGKYQSAGGNAKGSALEQVESLSSACIKRYIPQSIHASFNNAPDLSWCVCLFPHKIGALQGTGSRCSMPVE